MILLRVDIHLAIFDRNLVLNEHPSSHSHKLLQSHPSEQDVQNPLNEWKFE